MGFRTFKQLTLDDRIQIEIQYSWGIGKMIVSSQNSEREGVRHYPLRYSRVYKKIQPRMEK